LVNITGYDTFLENNSSTPGIPEIVTERCQRLARWTMMGATWSLAEVLHPGGNPDLGQRPPRLDDVKEGCS
jgi:hypothetical protein